MKQKEVPHGGSDATEKRVWTAPEIKSLNASETAVAKELDPEGGGGSIDLGGGIPG